MHVTIRTKLLIGVTYIDKEYTFGNEKIKRILSYMYKLILFFVAS